MPQPLSEYFVIEAGEYLAQLDRLLANSAAPRPEHLLRLARGVRGSARMAGAEIVAGVAERLEDAARSIVSQNIVWSDDIRALAVQTVKDLQVLLRALHRWGPAEEQRVRDAIERWDEHEAEPFADLRAVVDIRALFHDDDGPHVVSAPEPVPQVEVVPVETLLLRGDDALGEAVALRPRIERAMRGEPGGAPLGELLVELFDLLDLATERDGAAA